MDKIGVCIPHEERGREKMLDSRIVVKSPIRQAEGYIENSFCEANFRLSRKERTMFRAYGRLFKKAKNGKTPRTKK